MEPTISCNMKHTRAASRVTPVTRVTRVTWVTRVTRGAGCAPYGAPSAAGGGAHPVVGGGGGSVWTGLD